MTTSMAHHQPRIVGDLMLGTRWTAAALTGRRVHMVSRHCQPIACDVATRQPLYDLDLAHDTLRLVRRRVA